MIKRNYLIGELNGGTFQIRPHKEFHPIRGRDRLFALRLFSELPEIPSYLTNPTNAGLEPALPQRGLGIGSDMSDNAAMAIGSQSELRNRWVDPSMRKWTTSVRINSFAAIEHAPLCVSLLYVSFVSLKNGNANHPNRSHRRECY